MTVGEQDAFWCTISEILTVVVRESPGDRARKGHKPRSPGTSAVKVERSRSPRALQLLGRLCGMAMGFG